MIHLDHAIAVGAIGLLALVGCGNHETITSQTTSPTSSPSSTSSIAASPPATSKPTSTTAETSTLAISPEFQSLVTVVANTQKAVTSSDFSQAKAAFSKFEESWSNVEDRVKAKSPATYKTIEDSVDQVTAGIQAKNQEKTLSALQGLDQAIGVAAKT